MVDAKGGPLIKFGLLGVGGLVGLGGLAALLAWVLVRDCLQRNGWA